jgi:group II intron reverse transcriptase/maturase
MEAIVARGNMQEALRRVKGNQGSPGVDGVTTGDDLTAWLIQHWEATREQLLRGHYEPRPVRRCEIPKDGGGTRTLGIPSVIDRLIQQATLQVLQGRFDPTFSPSSYGFRPARRAHDAVRAAQRFINGGKTWVVDVDLESFFDRVNHDILMGKLATRLEDKRVLTLIRRFLTAGMMVGGVVREREEGTPQGGPLSPLLANVLLDEVDRELEKRGHSFARYADDCNVYVGSERAAQDVLKTLRGLYGRLRLKINEPKTAIDRPWKRKFLGFSFYWHKGEVRRRVAERPLQKFKQRVRDWTRRTTGYPWEYVAEKILGPYLRGWKGYFQLAQTPGIFERLDQWIRRRVRQIAVRQWKRTSTMYRTLIAMGVPREEAGPASHHQRRTWWVANHSGVTRALNNRYLKQMLKLPTLATP